MIKIIFLCMWLGISILDAASFDCTKARSHVEKIICSDAEISSLDSKLGRIYKSVLESIPPEDIGAFKNDGKIWIKKRNRCKDGACLVEQYTARISYLQAYSPTRPSNQITFQTVNEDVVHAIIKGNGEQCKVYMHFEGIILETNCLQLTNSKKIKIFCTKQKKICKTEKEVIDAFNNVYSPQDTTGTYEVTTIELNVRDNPGGESNVLGTVKMGDKVDVYEFSGKWAHTKHGWISGKYLKLIQKDRHESMAKMRDAFHNSYSPQYITGTYEVTTIELNVRDNPSQESNVLGTVKMGDKVDVYEFSGKWAHTKYGWISGKYLKLIQKDRHESTAESTGAETGTEMRDAYNQAYSPQNLTGTNINLSADELKSQENRQTKEQKIIEKINKIFDRKLTKCISMGGDFVTNLNGKDEFWKVCESENNTRIIIIESHKDSTHYQEIFFEIGGKLIYVKEDERGMPKNGGENPTWNWNCQYWISNDKIIKYISLGNGKTESNEWKPESIFNIYHNRISELEKVKSPSSSEMAGKTSKKKPINTSNMQDSVIGNIAKIDAGDTYPKGKEYFEKTLQTRAGVGQVIREDIKQPKISSSARTNSAKIESTNDNFVSPSENNVNGMKEKGLAAAKTMMQKAEPYKEQSLKIFLFIILIIVIIGIILGLTDKAVFYMDGKDLFFSFIPLIILIATFILVNYLGDWFSYVGIIAFIISVIIIFYKSFKYNKTFIKSFPTALAKVLLSFLYIASAILSLTNISKDGRYASGYRREEGATMIFYIIFGLLVMLLYKLINGERVIANEKSFEQ